jgi:hypothetical protein
MSESGISTSAVGSAQIASGAVDWSHFTSGLVLDTTIPTSSYTVGIGATVAPYDVVEMLSGNVYPVEVENFLGSFTPLLPTLDIVTGSDLDIVPLDPDNLTFATVVSENNTTTYIGWAYEPKSNYFMYNKLGAGYTYAAAHNKSFAVSPTRIVSLYDSASKVISARYATVPEVGLTITVGSPVSIRDNDGFGISIDGFQLNETQSTLLLAGPHLLTIPEQVRCFLTKR